MASEAAPLGANEPDALRLALKICKLELIKLQQLSDAPTSRIRVDAIVDHTTGTDRLRTRNHQALAIRAGGPAGESRIPDGVRGGTAGDDHAPSKAFSLYAHFKWRMGQAAKREDTTRLLELAAEARRDHAEYTGARKPSRHEDDKAAVEELLRDYAGVSAHEAAVWLHAPVKWVRRQRVLHGRDADYGEFYEMDARTKQILAMHEAGASERTIARELGCGRSTVRYHLEKHGRVGLRH